MSQLELTPANCNHPRVAMEIFIITQNGSPQMQIVVMLTVSQT